MDLEKIWSSKFLKYCFCGGISSITDLGIFFFINEILKVHYIPALIISFSIAVGVNYALQRKITFKNKFKHKHKQFAVFLSVMLVGLALNTIITVFQVEILHSWPTLAKFVSILLVTMYSYTTNKNLTFKLMQ
jgi:putative flippase GtrA